MLRRRELLHGLLGLGLGVRGAGGDEPQAGPRPVRRASPAAATLRGGLAKVDITPVKPVAMEGYLDFAERVSVGVHDRLYGRALAFSDGRSRLVLVSCDVCNMTFADYFERAIAERHGLQPGELLLCGIHTHSGPFLTLNGDYPANLEYTNQLGDLLVTLVGRALGAMRPVRLAVGRGRSAVGMSRRTIRPDGRVEMLPNPAGVADPEVLALTVRTPEGRVVGGLFNYACHSRSLRSPNRLLSGDVLGVAEQVVEGGAPQGPIYAAFAGTSGDVDPARVVDTFDAKDDGASETVRLATRLGEEAHRALAAADPVDGAPVVRLAAARVKLPPKTEGTKWVNVHAAAVGKVAFVGLDCEASVEIGLAVKAASPFPATFLLTHCNGSVGYLPVAHQYAEGGYEVAHSGFGPRAADVLVGEILTTLRGL